MRKGEVHAVLTENQRGHHYLEGLDLLAWGRCHLGLSLQLDGSDTTLLLRTGTGRSWNVSGRKCIVQDMRLPYLLWEGKGSLLSKALPYTGISKCTVSLYWSCCVAGSKTLALCPQNGPQNLLPHSERPNKIVINTKICNAEISPSRNINFILLLTQF